MGLRQTVSGTFLFTPRVSLMACLDARKEKIHRGGVFIMPRAPRLHIENAVYFITLEAPHGETLFKDEADYVKYVALLKAYRAEFGFKVFAFTLLANRLYLALEPGRDEFSISQIMQRLTPLYTKYFNERYDRRGPLFQKRFRSVIVEKQGYLTRLVRYFHWLPVKAGRAHAPGEYLYSSCSSMINLTTGVGNILFDLTPEVKELLALISPKPLAAYLSEAEAEELKFFDQKLSRGFVLGSESFVKEVQNKRRQNAQKSETKTEPEPITAARGGFFDFIRPAAVAVFGVLALAVAGASFMIYSTPFTDVLSRGAAKSSATVHSGAITYQESRPSTALVAAPVTTNPNTPRLPVSIQMPDLNGTVWSIDLVSVSADGTETPIEDKIQFVGPAFESYYFSSHGFLKSNYTVRVQNNGTITWETMQRNPQGETISWRGDWRGDRMEGVLSYKPSGSGEQVFSFMSHSAGVQK